MESQMRPAPGTGKEEKRGTFANNHRYHDNGVFFKYNDVQN